MRDDQRREIEELVELLSQHQLTELEIEKKGVRIKVRREPVSAAAQPPSSEPPVIAGTRCGLNTSLSSSLVGP